MTSSIGIQERYDDISKISGLSEDIIRRVLKASRQSIVKSLKSGERATLPGICTFTPELRDKINYKAESKSEVIQKYVKIKAKASPALDTELGKLQKFNDNNNSEDDTSSEDNGIAKLNFVGKNKSFESLRYTPSSDGVITKQINALL